MRGAVRGGFFAGLLPTLKIIGQQARGILTAVAKPNASAHVTHALAGCGKSTVLQCLVALHASHHAAALAKEAESKADAGADSPVLVVLLRTRTLRHEFVQALLRSQALAPEQVVFGGRLLDRFLEAGVVDDDVAHFQKIVLATPETRRLLREYEAALAVLLARHEGDV